MHHSELMYWTSILCIEHQPMCTKSMKLNKNCAGAMATVKNEVFIGLLHGNFYLMGTELAFGGRRNCSRCEVNEKTFG